MKREYNWKPWIAVVLLAILAMQTPALAQTTYRSFIPIVGKSWIYYLPYINLAPSPTPTPTSTFTPIPTATKSPTPIPTTSAVPGVPPAYSSSVYLLTVDGTQLYNLGCQYGAIDRNLAGSRDTIVILDFGSPKQINGEYGTDLFWMGPVTITQIKAAVENFGKGYYICASTDRTSQIFVGIGTTNYGSTMNASTTAARALGIAWAQMVNDVNTWLIGSGYSGQVHAVGANDIELNWSSATIARAWVDGYDSINLYDYYDFGAAEGCAIRSNPNLTTCSNGWTREDAWYKAYGTRPGFPIPEIYNTNGLNAQQWALLSLYSVNYKGYKIDFRGLMTQYQACQQAAGQCSGVDNTPNTGWMQLYNELAKSPYTAQSPKWLTDILWGYNMPTGPSAAAVAISTPTPGAPSTPQTNAPQEIVNTYPSLLAQPSISAQMKASLQEKLTDARRLLSDKAAGDAHPASKDASVAPSAPSVGNSGFPIGIFEGAGGVIHSWEGTMSNHWQNTIGSDFVIVSAGVSAEDASQGMLVVMRVSGDRIKFTRNVFLTPQKAGTVQVTAANGTLLALQAANGTQFTFDAATNTFK
jgi:hypothetical protein